MNKIGIFMPTLGRPQDLQKVATNIEEATHNTFTLYFGCEQDDKKTIEAARATGHRVIVNRYEPGGYSNTIQAIYEAADEPFFIHANDDFEFKKDWDIVPLSMFEREDLMVVGMPQTEGDTHGSAISMVRRKYIKEQSGVIDMPNRVFYPYPHHYVDTEFTRTAQYRNVWAMCQEQGIIHHHPGFSGRPHDATYIKNDATSETAREMFEKRQHLWGGV